MGELILSINSSLQKKGAI